MLKVCPPSALNPKEGLAGATPNPSLSAPPAAAQLLCIPLAALTMA